MFLSLFSVSPPYRQAMLKDNLLGRLHQLLKPQVKNSSFLAATTKNRKKGWKMAEVSPIYRIYGERTREGLEIYHLSSSNKATMTTKTEINLEESGI